MRINVGINRFSYPLQQKQIKKNYFPTMLKKLNAMNIIIKSQIIKPENALV